MLKSLSNRRLRNLNRRQCKKHHVLEFQVFGFEVFVTFKTPQEETEMEPFWDDFYTHVEKLGLQATGLGGAMPILETEAFFVSNSGTTSEAQKASLIEWLEKQASIAKVHTSEPIDAWYCD